MTRSPVRASGEGFGVYVHWPFCLAKCPYCDFNSHVRHKPVDQAGFADALVREIGWFAGQSGPRTVTSVFFGGGTPSLMSPETVATILEAVAARWTLAGDAEITLEANPTSVEARNFAGYRSAGVNRASIGMQSLNDRALKFLGRQHSAEEALEAFKLAERIFPRVSFDMIYALPEQSTAAWRQELSTALEHASGHMSLYQLTIEPETRFADLAAAGKLTVPDESLGLALYDVTQELTDKAGLPAYEVSNHAAPGQECRHNLLYWGYGDYAGVGPGAHSRLAGEGQARLAYMMHKNPELWRNAVQANGRGLQTSASLLAAESGDEYLLMGLRLTGGISLDRHAALGGREMVQERLNTLRSEGLITLAEDGRQLAATPAGRRVLNAVVGYLAS